MLKKETVSFLLLIFSDQQPLTSLVLIIDTAFVDLAKSMGPSSIDMELRTLPLDGELTVLNHFMEAILFIIRSRKNFELAQAWLNVFLNIHGDVIISNPENDIHDKLQETLALQKEEFGRLSQQIHYGLCLIDFARK